MDSKWKEQRMVPRRSNYASFVVTAAVLFVFVSKYRLFSFRYSVLSYLIVICAVPVLFFWVNTVRAVRFKAAYLWYFLFAVALLVNSFSGSVNRSNAIFFAINKLLLFFLFYYLSLMRGWRTSFSRCAEMLAKVLAASVLLELIVPDVISGINAAIMNLSDYKVYKRLYNMGYHLGFSIQASYLSFNIAILLSILIGRMLTNRSRRTDLAWLAACVLVIILSGKRAEFIGAVLSVASVVILILCSRNTSQRRKIGILFLCLFISGLTVYLLYYTSYGALLFRKGMTLSYDNTRTFLRNEALKLWRRSPITGNGTNYFSQKYDLSAHNTYLQLLCENGIIGLAFFLGFVLANAGKSIALFWKLETSEPRSGIVLASICFQVFFLISAYFESTFTNEVMWIVYLIMSAVAYSVTEERKLVVRRGKR